MSRYLVLFTSLAGLVASSPILDTRHGGSLSNSRSSITLLYQNNLNFTDDFNHVGALLLDPMFPSEAQAACAGLSESLISQATLQQHESDFAPALSYNAYAGRASHVQNYLIENGIVTVFEGSPKLSFSPLFSHQHALPVLCTQSSSGDNQFATPTAQNQVSVSAGGNTYIGFRNQKSFRFLGIPYANPPTRFEYSVPYSATGQTLNVTEYGSQCAQPSSGSENCLFLNIQTPYLPKAGRTNDLRPVLFWIHGGGFTGGSGADFLTDGGNLASREDIVVVTINYRLSTLGFLAIPGTDIKGNFGIADQINALEWTIRNIAQFGGDPYRITINGESAGAGSVRTLLGSPRAIGKFQGAISMSNLGGGVDLGLGGDYATTYSSYLTIEESYAQAGQGIFEAAGCTQSALSDQIACLTTVPALTLVEFGDVARFVVQDGVYVNTEELILTRRNGSAAFVPIMFGNCANDGASFSTYPRPPVSTELQGIIAALDISQEFAQSIIDSQLFPYLDTGNVTLDSFNVSQRVATDNQFRCIEQATVYAGFKNHIFPATYYYQQDRTAAGFDPNNLGGPPVTPGFPFGNPNLPYFRLHGSDLPWAFGNLFPLRDTDDLYSIQLETAYFAEFVKTGQPNPPESYLIVRNYEQTLAAVRETGPWNAVSGPTGPMRLMDYPATPAPFQDLPQCAFLNYSISYYVDGGI